MKNTIFVLAIALLANQPALAAPGTVYSPTQFFGFFSPKPEWAKHHRKDSKQHLPKVHLDTKATKLGGDTVYGDKSK